MKKEGENYDINNNYMKNFSFYKRSELEILIRNFILWIVVKFEKHIDFMYEFNINNDNNDNFSKILEKGFKSLHSDIEIKENISDII